MIIVLYLVFVMKITSQCVVCTHEETLIDVHQASFKVIDHFNVKLR